MTQNGRPGGPVVVSWGGRLDMFARAPDDSLLHVWSAPLAFGGTDEGAELLPGILAGDPTAVSPAPNRLDVFARGVGGFLLHWLWSDEERRIVGPENRSDRIAYDPVAVALAGGAMAVYARSATDDLLEWRSPDRHTLLEASPVGGVATSKPAAVYRPGASSADVFARGGAGGLLTHWGKVHVEGSSEDREGWEELDGDLAGPPTVVAWAPDRLDVLAPLTDGRIEHWGWAGKERYYDALGVWHTGRWYGPDGNLSGTHVGSAVTVSPRPDFAEMYARSVDGSLVVWLWDGTKGFSPYNFWEGPITVGGPISSAPAALILDGKAHVFAWDSTGTTLLRFVNEGGVWSQGTWPFNWPSIVAMDATKVRAKTVVDYLVERPSDMAVLGVSWSGYQLSGEPPVLQRVPGVDTRLALSFPPQHVGEEVSPGTGPFDPPIHEFVIAPFGSWHAALSGPSQLVFEPTADLIPLTLDGILAATQGARIVPASPEDTAPQTAIELPWQLLIAPGGDALSEHRRSATASPNGTFGLWRARLNSSQQSLEVLDAGGSDPFPMALGLGSRQLIAAQEGPARVSRLELSALGGSLSAHGTWDAVTWEHDTSLGRDQRVRVQVQGVLYPFGHRAEYVELTERFPAEPDAEPIAMLRKRRVLTVTEPVRLRAGEPDLARAFPFDSVELLTGQFGDLDDPWLDGEKFVRPPRPPAGPMGVIAQLRSQLLAIPDMPGDFAGGPPVMEREVLSAALDPDSELAAEQTAIASEHLRLIEAIQRTEEQIAAIMEARTEEVPWFFCPRRQGRWVTVTAQCTTGEIGVDLELPMLFVVDQQLPETETMTGFDSLRDGDIARKLPAKWATIRQQLGDTGPPPPDPDAPFAGVVRFAATPMDLVGSGKVGDVQVVNRLNITGVQRDRSIHPRLGPDRTSPEPAPGPTWGLNVELPALRSLLPGRPESHSALVSFSKEFEVAGAAADVAFDVMNVPPLEVDFTRNADRSGGLVSPKIVVDAISRETGPVNAQGLLSLKAEDYFDSAATILGFPLISLLDDLLSAPAITTDLSGPQPVVELAWTGVEITPESPFGLVDDPATPTTPAPTLTLTVRSCGAETTTHCELNNFSLSFPASSPLLTLKFESLTYDQTAGKAPTLDVSGLDASFSGALDVLQALQEKVDLGDSAPAISVSDREIVASYTLPVPDAAAGAFVMRNLAFRAGVVVPFGGEPVSVSVGFATRSNPFNLSVLALGGGGYIDIELDSDGLRRLDVALEFGASVAVDFVIAQGEAHVLGGIRFELLPDSSVLLTGYLRIGGSLEVLGLVSVSVELVLSLGYQTAGNRLVGRATLVLEIDLTLFSESVELDSGEWVIAGGEEDRPMGDPEAFRLDALSPGRAGALPASGTEGEADPFLDAWLAHRRAFETMP